MIAQSIEVALWLLGTGIGLALSWRFMLWANALLGPRPD
jgi:hypothetical protein